uniref:Meckel syndrome type 1 protein n=1 Tax=Dendroctonus ponderosae TaxID=77166 RepID=A0AAR5QII4_DENPD
MVHDNHDMTLESLDRKLKIRFSHNNMCEEIRAVESTSATNKTQEMIKIKEDNSCQAEKPETLYLEKVFGWQEKVFSKEQKEYYSDERNCFTEREKEYHKLISEDFSEEDDYLLFSYCTGDEFYVDHEIMGNTAYLEERLNNLAVGRSNISDGKDAYDYNTSVIKSIENPLVRNTFENMYIMADFGQNFEGTWLKNEKLLCTVGYNKQSKILRISPDITNTQRYVLKIHTEKERIFNYYIEHCSNNVPESIEVNEKTLIKKINDFEALKKEKLFPGPFKLPPRNKLYVFVFMEICSAKGFEYSDIFVQYQIKLPQGWFSSDLDHMKGRTHLCRAADENGLVHFGHNMEILLEYNLTNLGQSNEYSQLPYVYFEIISKGSWNRYRTEGLCYLQIPIYSSRTLTHNLKCFRFTKNPISEMRRYFIGDYQNYDDVSWIGIPNGYQENTINKYGTETICTGELNIKINVLHQSQEFLEERRGSIDKSSKTMLERLGSSALLKSVEQVIQEFKKARKEMLDARKHVADIVID